MASRILKSAATWSIARGVRLPQQQLERTSELTFLKRLLGELGTDLVLDVGANTGQFASELRSIGYAGHIVSFEPVASAFAAMTASMGRDERWRGLHHALGKAEDTLTLNIPAVTTGSSFLDSDEAYPDGCTQQEVAVKRLDSLLPDLVEETGATNVFLKMDTQGYDLEVFAGAAGCLDLIAGLQSELSVYPLYHGMPHYLEALTVYEDAGFDLYNLSVVNRLPDGALLELNAFMRKKG